MTCNPTRIELSNDATTSVSFTVDPAPSSASVLYFDAPGLGVDTEANLDSNGQATISVSAVTADTNSIWDGTIQVGSNSAVTVGVQVVDSPSSQNVGVTLSDSGVTYCAPSSGGGGGDDPIQERTYSKNLDIVAQDMISGQTSVMILGDSINNPMQATFMKHGYMNEWKPNYWRGLNAALTTGAATVNGFMITGGIGSQVEGYDNQNGPDPENTNYTGSDHKGRSVQGNIDPTDSPGGGDPGPQPGRGQFLVTSLSTSTSLTNWEGFRVSPVYPITSPPWDGQEQAEYLSEWKGTQQGQPMWLGEFVRYRLHFYSDTGGNIEIWWKYGDDVAFQTSGIINLGTGYTTVESPITDNSGSRAQTGATQVWFRGAQGQSISLIGVIAEDTQAAGLTLSYMGGGGWKTENHAVGDSTAPGTPGTDDRSAYYIDSAAQAYLEYTDTDVVMIQLGANDPQATGVSDHLPDVIQRFRNLKSGLKFLLVSQYNVNGDDQQGPRWDAQSEYMRGLAGSAGNEDVAFLDLNKMVLNEVGQYSEWGATTAPSADKLLVDGIHPNEAGAEKFAELEWAEIVASAGAAGSEASWPSKGSSELTTVGTITTGRWSASPVALDHGGTGSVTAADARKALGVTNTGAYTGQIETADDKTYTLDPGVVAPRTITGFYIKSDSGTCTANLKVGSDVVKTASVSTSSGDQTPLAYTEVDVDDVITLVISSNSSATDVTFSVEYSS